ncbi:MAG: hypothetical protein KDD69_11895 [Bdellovibrionales bacterium]|nr:hypothetical protein [Bdellovibrionales bacterium]
MIHTLVIDGQSDPNGLLKEFRKKLMTGGAVVRLPDTLSAAELERVVERFTPEAAPHNLHSMVLVEVAKHASLTEALRSKLADLSLPNVQRALARERSRA